MQKGQAQIVLIGILVIAVVAAGAYYLGRQTTPKPLPAPVVSQSPRPSPTDASGAASGDAETANFNFIFKYGVSDKPNGPRNILDTSNQTYTKDMIFDKDVTTKLSLTNEERKQILHKMLSINLFESPENFLDNPASCKLGKTQTPYSSYDLTVMHEARVKHLSWDDQFTCEDNLNLEVQKLRELSLFIIDIIESKEEYKKLPPAKGGYL